MKKGDIITGVVTDYDFPNKGSLFVCEENNPEKKKVTVKGALPGQEVRVRITRKKTGLIEGAVEEVLKRAENENVIPSCPHVAYCGGCTYTTLSYDEQLKLKEQLVKKLLDRVLLKEDSNSADYVWEGILASPKDRAYRNKMEYTFGDEVKDGPLTLGMHKKGSFHDIIDVDGCELVGAEWSMIVKYTKDFFAGRKVPYYHRMRHEGILRSLVVRQSRKTGEFLVNLVTSTQWDRYGFGGDGSLAGDADRKEAVNAAGGADRKEAVNAEDGAYREEAVNAEDGAYRTEAVNAAGGADRAGAADDKTDYRTLLKEYADGLMKLSADDTFAGKIAGVLYTENDTLGDVVQCDRMEILCGRDYIIEEVMGLYFKVSPFSFFQTNTGGCEVLYSKAREYIMDALTGSGTREVKGKGTTSQEHACGVLYDLYSGTGTIAQMMAPVAEKVIGVEIVEEAVIAARENAKSNRLDNCEFIAGDVLKTLDEVEEKPDMIIVDPPRDGINPKALTKILSYGVNSILYISCKPTSLARDLAVMTASGYRVVKACAVDQFPKTANVETIVGIQRVKS